jgi:hypothetical protein
VLVLLVDLPLCGLLLGLDGLVRDGTPLVVSAGLALYALRRASRAGPAGRETAGAAEATVPPVGTRLG